MKIFLKKIFYPLDFNDRKNLLIIFFISLLSAALEIVGIGLLIPILNIFVGNEYIKYLDFLPFLYSLSKNELIKAIIILFLTISIIKFLINIYLIIKKNTFSNNLYRNLSKKFFKYYLSKGYIFYTQNHSSTLIRNISQETNIYSFGIVLRLITLVSELIIFLSISILLLTYSLTVSSFILILFSGLGLIIYKINSKKLKDFGEIRQFHTAKYLKQLQQGFLSFREMIINQLQFSLLNKFSHHISKFTETNKKKEIITEIPRYVIELIGIFTIAILFWFLSFRGYKILDIVVILGVFFYAIIRILPIISRILQSVQSLKFNKPALEEVYKIIKEIEKEFDLKNRNIAENKINFNNFKNIKFDNVDFSFRDNKKILKGINLQIKKGDKIGLTGKSGSGKSTFVNLLCGLIESTSGNILIDGNSIKDTLFHWQRSIGYVPQVVSIFDETVLFNITLKENKNEVDFNRLEEILKLLDLNFLIDNLQNKLDEFVGENGVKLSGGQCQRLGIARALYKNPAIIILDEATNGIDKDTEDLILDKLFIYKPDLTILSISHKENALKNCTRILKIENYLIKDKSKP